MKGIFAFPSGFMFSMIRPPNHNERERPLTMHIPADPLGGAAHHLTGRVKELDGLVATQDRGIMSFHPIHSENKVNGGRLQNEGGNKEFKFFDFTRDIV